MGGGYKNKNNNNNNNNNNDNNSIDTMIRTIITEGSEAAPPEQIDTSTVDFRNFLVFFWAETLAH